MKDWERIEEIFGDALRLAPEQQRRHLDEVCGDDDELRRQVATLLRASSMADGFMEEAARIHGLATPPEAGERLGSYRILRRIGEGGMGTVWLAERDDETFTRQVAVKVLRADSLSVSAVERLERERQILAGLDHPGIARLLDGGTTAAGLPYVVMELVDGEPIDQACRRRQLSPAARVDLVLAVCDAVTAAHRNLVVHRDLKPSNILVDAGGRPRLLDFGIAKLLDSGYLGGASEPTKSWDRRLTPAYASPEQLRGEHVTVATDVYLLGVVLYELLAGELPHRFESGSLLDMERRVTTQTPRRPSELVSGLDPDLDAIVLKALRTDPRARYGSVEELAEDLRRHRRGWPVGAMQGNVRYLAGKFLRRHWLAVGTALLIALLVTSFATSTWVQAVKIERTLGRLIAVESFLVDLFWAASPDDAKGRRIPVEEILERGERQLELGKVREPGSRGLLHALFGRISLHLGELARSREHLEKALLAYGEVDGDPYLEVARVRVQSDLAMNFLFAEEDFERAEMLALEALEKGHPLLSQDPEGLLELLNNLATIYCWQGKWDEAQPLVEQAHTTFEGREDVPSPQSAETLTMKAMLLMNHAKKPEEARRLYEKALDIYRRLEGRNHPEIARILNQLGLLSMDLGHSEAAVGQLRESLDVREAIFPEGHWEIGQSLYQLGALYRRTGDLTSAEELVSRAMQVFEQDPDYDLTHGQAILIRLQLAEIRLELGKVEKAGEMIDELPPEWWASRKPTSLLLALARRANGCTLAAQGELEEAQALLSQSLETLRNRLGNTARETELARDCLDRVRDQRMAPEVIPAGG